MSTLLAWLKASRLPSQSYIAPPLLFGQAWHFHHSGELSWPILLLVQLFGLFDQLFIVYANDYADRDTDKKNRTATVFSGGSRVLVDGDLAPRALRHGAWLMAVAGVATAFGLAFVYGRWLVLPLAGGSLLLLWAYSYPPLRLSYRGGGELLQMLGVALVLPFFGFYAQAGTVNGFAWNMLWVLLPTHLACAIATALPDEPSDRDSKKRTLVVLWGPVGARLAVVGLNLVSIFALAQSDWLDLEVTTLLTLLLVPSSATLAQLFLLRTRPGSWQISVQVFLAILVTLSLVVTLCLVLWLATP